LKLDFHGHGSAIAQSVPSMVILQVLPLSFLNLFSNITCNKEERKKDKVRQDTTINQKTQQHTYYIFEGIGNGLHDNPHPILKYLFCWLTHHCSQNSLC
jgi:hypothetical protein